ncbi:hypothetical protein [Streptomyces sp. NPDC056069]|uniref:hypothetical protein n=1 Tax=Streptomyces sp. NPDC056069 TaxID=3345702 RepID=UPI0035DEA675
MLSSLRVRSGAAAVAVAGAALALVATATPASAGSNGQQIRFQDRSGHAYSVKVSGYNQDNEWVDNCWNIAPGSTNTLGGWWWKYDVNVQSYNSYNCTSSQRRWWDTVSVPRESSQDTYLVVGY